MDESINQKGVLSFPGDFAKQEQQQQQQKNKMTIAIVK